MSWRIRVKDIQGKEGVVVINETNPGRTTVAQLKKKLQDGDGPIRVHPAKQKLIFNRNALSDNMTLDQCGIGNDSCLQIFVVPGLLIEVKNQHDPGSVLTVFMDGHNANEKTVMDVKRKIVEIQGDHFMKLHEIRLFNKQPRELCDEATLKDSGIVDNDMLSMRKKSSPPWNIFIQGISGKTHTIVLANPNPEETTVHELKKKVEKETTFKPEEQRLCYGSKPLADNQCLEDYNITNNSSLNLVIRCLGGASQGIVALLRESETSTINNVPNCPIFRACPHCGTLLEHTGGCNNMDCRNCKKRFCFVCLALPSAQNSSQPSCNNQCKAPATRQTNIIQR